MVDRYLSTTIRCKVECCGITTAGNHFRVLVSEGRDNVRNYDGLRVLDSSGGINYSG